MLFADLHRPFAQTKQTCAHFQTCRQPVTSAKRFYFGLEFLLCVRNLVLTQLMHGIRTLCPWHDVSNIHAHPKQRALITTGSNKFRSRKINLPWKARPEGSRRESGTDAETFGNLVKKDCLKPHSRRV